MAANHLQDLLNLSRQLSSGAPLLKVGGRISAIGPDYMRVSGLQHIATIDCRVEFGSAADRRFGSIAQITDDEVLVVPFEGTSNLRVGDTAYICEGAVDRPNQAWLGRVLNALGIPMDGLGVVKAPSTADQRKYTYRANVSPMKRARVVDGFKTGIRAIDIFTPLCYGQRIGIFAGSGVGKSTLLGMLAQAEAFDCVVVALVGERSREVREFLEDSVGKSALAKTVCIVATGDQSALMRKTAPLLAMEAAEHFRDRGNRVLFLLDSVTRFAHAIREVGSTAGEPPVARGYPPSVFAEIPKLLERAGPGEVDGGSITALVSVLVDGDDLNDPVADSVRGILDGHIVLSREIANQGRYPPIDILGSLSRLAPRVWTVEQKKLVHQLRVLISRYEDSRDLRVLGNWRAGEDEQLDKSVATVPSIYSGLIQSPEHPLSADAFADLLAHLKNTMEGGQDGRQTGTA